MQKLSIIDIRNEKFDMRRLLIQLLLNSLIFINATALFCDSIHLNELPSGYRLPNGVIPEHYNIQLEPYIEKEGKSFHFFGRCEAYIKIIRPTWNISLHAQQPQLKIQNATVVDEESSYFYKPTNITYNKETHILIFHFDYKLSNKKYLLNISFIGFSNNIGAFFRTAYNIGDDKMWFVVTQLRAIGARQLFPCWDEPAFKATFNISVKRHWRYSVVSNMPIKHTIDNEDIMSTYFETTRLMSTYLVTIAVFDADLFPSFNMDAQYKMLLQDTAFAEDLVYKIIMSFRIKLKYSRNLLNVHHLITPKGPQHNSMGLILYK